MMAYIIVYVQEQEDMIVLS